MLVQLNNADILAASVSFSSLNNVQCTRNKPLIVLHKNLTSDLKQLSSLENMSQMIWLLFADLDLELNGLNIPFDCEFLVARQELNNMVLTEVYRIGPSHPLQYHHFGIWSLIDGLSCTSIGLYRRRNNLQGLALMTGFMKTKRMIASEEEEKRISPTGYYGEIWKQLEEKMNFSTHYLNPKDNMFGGKTANGTWTGVLGMLQNREVEVTNVAFVMSSLRMEAFDFTVPLLNIRTYLMIRQPETYALKWTAFLKPFEWQLWLVAVICAIILTAFLTFFFLVGYSYGDIEIKSFGFSTAIFIAYGIFCMQGQNISTVSTPLRLTLVTSYLTAVILVASYSASFISHLTLRRPTLPFNTFDEFFNDRSYQLGMMPNSAQLDYFKSSKVELLNKIYNKKLKPCEALLPKSDFEGLQRMCREKFAFAMSTYSLMYQGEIKICSYVQIPQAFFPGSLGITIRKRSPYKGLFNYMLESMHQSGIFSIVYERFTYHLRHDVHIPMPMIAIADVTPILIVLSVGILLATFFFLSEFFSKKYINTKQTKRTEWT